MKRVNLIVGVLAFLLVSAGVAATATSSGGHVETTRVSVASDGSEGNGDSWYAAISADGRIVAYDSDASTLVPDDSNNQRDVFIFDRASRATTLVSLSSGGVLGNGMSEFPTLSADGRIVVYHSHATNLVTDDTNGVIDVFAFDRVTSETTRLSVASDSSAGNASSIRPVPSADGRLVVFYSDASNLVSNDTNDVQDVFLHDRATGTTTRISVASDGSQSNGDSTHPSISADGRLVAFDSAATNLVTGDTNGVPDIFVYDRDSAVITRVSLSTTGAQGDGNSREPVLAGDGGSLSFISDATTLVPDDTNGVSDIFAHDLSTGATTRASVASDGSEGNDRSLHSSISGDGRLVAYYSFASNLVISDTNAATDVFVHDVETGSTTRISIASDGTQADKFSFDPWLSADGRVITYSSDAANLVPNDTNGRFDVFVYAEVRRTFLPAIVTGNP